MRAATLACVLALALAGCAQNAVLELQLMLPARDALVTAPIFALVQVRRADAHPFEVDWQPQADAQAVELGDAPARVQLSVIGRDPTIDLHVKVRFCGDPDCDGIDDADAPERWFAIEHPFYVGRRTAWAACVEDIPAARPSAPIEVERCEIHGCTAGGATSYCDPDGTGPHFCETSEIDDAPGELRCVDSMAQY
ncbi:MAG: hypothetical protein M3Y87_27775 [Myxococcota bacterium]|nr:hypothetical protein [Myxococcota bacterium]